MTRILAALLAALALAPAPGLAAEFPLQDGRRVLFLGDSITQSGGFVQDVEAYLFTRFPDRKVEIVNLGLSSETASGLTEPDHPYPRPDVRDRLGRALELVRPGLVVANYGMNDGIYHPPVEDRLAAYREGIAEVVDRCRKAGAEVILGTPGPFDPRPGAKLQPLGAPAYGYKTPFADYDAVLAGYGSWLLSKRSEGWEVVNVRGAIARFVAAARRADPAYTVAPDGVHPDASGHWLIAAAYLDAWDAPAEVNSAAIDAQSLMATAGAVADLARDGPAIRFSWTTRIPMPHDPQWSPRFVEAAGIDARFNRHRLTVTGLDRPRYAVFEGDRKVGEATRETLAAGLDLLGLPDLSTNRRAAELRPLVVRRERALWASWLQEVGHGPPLMGQAPPLDQARTQAAALEAQIRDLARPVPIRLRLAPVEG